MDVREAGSRGGQRQRPSQVGGDGILAVDARDRYRASVRDRWTPERVWRWLLLGERRPAIPSYTGLVEDVEASKIGIACSGGGIRSASFGLGALQVLCEHRVLEKARYLAGVSGGSYIVSAFCSVRQTWPPGAPRPPKPRKKRDDSDPLGWDSSNPDCIRANPPFYRGSPEEQYLRNRSSYLAPGAFGRIRFAHRVLLGMALNLALIGAMLFVLSFPLGLLYQALYPSLKAHLVAHGLCRYSVPAPHGGTEHVDALCRLLPTEISRRIWLPIVILAGVGIVFGWMSFVFYRATPFVRQILEVWSLRLLLIACVAGFLLVGLPLLLALYRAWGTAAPKNVRPIGHGLFKPGLTPKPTGGSSVTVGIVAGTGGVATLGGAVLLQLRAEWLQARKALDDLKGVRSWYAKLAPWVRKALANLIATLLGPALALAAMVLAMTLILEVEGQIARWEITVGSLAVFAVAYMLIDITTWSLHSFYRRRLCSAFSLKRVALPEAEELAGSPIERTDHPPIAAPDAGGAHVPGVARERYYRKQERLSRTAINDAIGPWPTLLVCAAANVSDEAATPPGRKVTSFTFSSHALGGPLVGAVRTVELEDACDATRRWYFTLPAAVAMSGAALSPSMGKMTRGPLRFLIGLANVRLGVWVPNPRRIDFFSKRLREAQIGDYVDHGTKARYLGDKVRLWLQRPRTLPHLSYLLRELLGMNPLNAPYLYVTDGGHYENLGLVELLRRGCTEVYCFDASNDNFDAIGDAIALARSELDVEIDIDYTDMQVDPTSGRAKRDCVEGKIKYPDKSAPEAKLYYARLVLTSTAPADVLAYHGQDARFPHDPTTDQLYTDQRFEAYRALGADAALSALSLSQGGPAQTATGRPTCPEPSASHARRNNWWGKLVAVARARHRGKASA